MSTPSAQYKLSDIQLHLLRFLGERAISDEETAQIQRVIANYYAQKADERMDEIWEQRGYSAETMDEILNAPLRKPADASGH